MSDIGSKHLYILEDVKSFELVSMSQKLRKISIWRKMISKEANSKKPQVCNFTRYLSKILLFILSNIPVKCVLKSIFESHIVFIDVQMWVEFAKFPSSYRLVWNRCSQLLTLKKDQGQYFYIWQKMLLTSVIFTALFSQWWCSFCRQCFVCQLDVLITFLNEEPLVKVELQKEEFHKCS